MNDRPIGDMRSDLWIVADAPTAAAVTAAEAAGFRIARSLSVMEAAVALLSRRDGPMVIIEIGETLSGAAADLLDLLDMQARNSRSAVIVSCTLATLDAVAARLSAPYATLLCDPSPVDRVIALCAAIPDLSGVAEDRTADARQLLRLTDEVARIARVLAGMPDDTGVRDGLVGYRGPPASGTVVPIDARNIREMIRWRRRRDALFPELFADPAWDMMLDLAAAGIEARDVSVSSLCIAAAVPATTALRWIKTLTDARIFERIADPYDRRRVYIRLADTASAPLLRFLGEAKGAGATMI